MRTAVLQKSIDNLWTVQEVCKRMKKSPMTIHLWRKHRGLPAVVIPGQARASIRFVPDEVIRWAKKEEIEITE